MATELEYALAAGRVYQSTTGKINWFPDLQSLGWTEYFSQQETSGFEALSFQKGNELIISFAGTGSNVDWWANGAGFSGVSSDQLRQAADYYLQVKAANPDATISFTGHSLGGGLASLMAVFFGGGATTFDQAPFRNSANASVAASLKDYLLQHGYGEIALQSLTDFIDTAGGGSIPREGTVRDFSVQGEVLSVAAGLRIGVPITLTHGGADLAAATDLHSQALLTAFLQSDQYSPSQYTLREVTLKLHDVVAMIFDNKLFRYSTALDSTSENLMERLVRHQSGVAGLAEGETSIIGDAMLTRFTADLWKLAKVGGLTMSDGNATNAQLRDVSKSLIAFTMQMYYEDTANATNPNKELFAAVSGGIQFDMADVSPRFAAAFSNGEKLNLADAKGFGDQYFGSYLKQSAGVFTPEDAGLIGSMLPYVRDWYVQAGLTGLSITDVQNRGAFMLGGVGSDTLTGGSAADLLVGNAGADSLAGGSGADIVLGGAGSDTVAGGEGSDLLLGGLDHDSYLFTGNFGLDIVRDADGQIKVGELPLAGGNRLAENVYVSDGGITYVRADSELIIRANAGTDAGVVTAQEWQPGELGITLSEQPAASVTPATTLNGDFKKKLNEQGTGYLMVDGNYVADGAESASPDLLTGTSANELIQGFGGNDALLGGGGDDNIAGGDGADVLMGGLGADTVSGGAGNDLIYGSSTGSLEYPSNASWTLNDGGLTILAEGWNWRIYTDGSHDVWGIPRLLLSPTVGRDEQFGDAGNVIDGGAGDDQILAGTGDDIVHGGADKDDIAGMGGSDVLFGDANDDVIVGDGSADSWRFDYAPPGAHGNDILLGGSGNDVLIGQGGSDVLVGGSDNDTLYGDDYDDARTPQAIHASDQLDGGDGNDLLHGGGGDDLLIGGKGNDTLAGGTGRDIYTINSGEGVDWIFDTKAEGNIIRFGSGVNSSNVKLSLGSLMLELGGGDQLHIDGFDPTDARNSVAIDSFEFADGTVLTKDELLDRGFDLDGTTVNDTILGTNVTDRISGLDGNDLLAGNAGDDMLDGGTGDDELQGGDGDDDLLGADGNDRLYGSSGADSLNGGLGGDQLQGGDDDDQLLGAEGDDSLWGDAGNDTLLGDVGNDSLQGGVGNDFLLGGADNDTLFGQGGDDSLEGGAGRDALQGGDDNDSLLGQEGNDDLFGQSGDDSLEGGDGDDWLDGAAGNDTLIGGTGVDTLMGGAGDDVYVFAPGDSSAYVSLAEVVNDLEGVNHIKLVGEEFSPISAMTMTPKAGGVLELQTGRGVIGIYGYSSQYMNSGAIGTVEVAGVTYNASQFYGKTYAWDRSGTWIDFAQGGRLADTMTTQNANSTFVGGAGDDILNGKWGKNLYRYDLGDGLDTINDTSPALDFLGRPQSSTVAFGAGIASDGIRLSTAPGSFVIKFADQPGGIRITGFDLNNALQNTPIDRFTFADGTELTHAQLIARGFDIAGTSAAETLTGTNLADRLTGSTGNDTLIGAGAADAYTFNIGDGSDVIADGDSASGPGDSLKFGEGIAPADVRATRSGNDVTFYLAADRVTLRDYFGGGADAVEQIAFADGTQWTQAEVLDVIAASSQDSVLLGGDGNDLMQGLGGNDLIEGRAGNDTLMGGGGNDTLIAGAGIDVLNGEGGGDTYVVGLEGAGWDSIDETAGGDTTGVDVVQFVDGILRQDVTVDVSGNDITFRSHDSKLSLTIRGQYAGDDAFTRIEQFAFDDGSVLTADELKTQLLKGRDSGFDTSDTWSGNAYRNYFSGLGGNDTLAGLQGNDTLYGGVGNDSLSGGLDNDLLYGEDGDDTLDGGAGWDSISGGLGNDTYVFGVGSGNDIVFAEDGGIDRILLATELTSANVTLHRVSAPPRGDIAFQGDSLVVQLNGGADQLWVANFFDPANLGNIETIAFGDGTTWDYGAIVARLATPGGTANTMTGTTKANSFTVDHWNDAITDPGYGDADKVTASVSYRLPSNVNDLTLTGSLNLFAQGSSDSDILRGNAGSNWYDFVEGAGYDTLAGGKGDDVYVVRSSRENWTPGADPTWMGGATISELAGEGVDTLVSGFWSAQLPANVENLVMTTPNPRGTVSYYPYGINDYTHRFIGNGADNIIDAWLYEAYAGSNPGFPTMRDYRLDGGAGADTLIGGVWNDTYVIDHAGDVVQETMGGSDTVETPFQTSLLTDFANIENVTLVGTSAVSATGADGDNKLSGALNTAANRLEGGLGNDTYTVGAGDMVAELVGQGTDLLIVAGATGAVVRLEEFPNVENLRLQAGSSVTDAQGTAEANILTGNSAANHLAGLAGSDTISDQYPEDFTFYSSVSPEADNDTLEGGEGDDILYSYGGIDVMHGGAGDDQLTLAYSGRTTIVKLGLGDGHDVLSTQAAAAVTVEFGSGILPRDVQLQQQADPLVVALSDGSSVTLANSNLLTLRFADGTTIEPAQVSIMLLSDDRTTATAGADVLFGTGGLDTISGLAGDDAVFAGDGDDVLLGGDGNDTLYGGSGSDLLEGGLGDDRLLGGADADTLVGGGGSDVLAAGAGADVYRFTRGSGQDSADDTFSGGASPAADDGALDVVEMDVGVLPTDVAVYRQVNGTTASALVLAITNTADRLSLEHAYAANGVGAIELVRFVNGTQWDLPTLKSKIAGEVGYEGNDTLVAPITSARLEGRGGNDSMTGSSGADTLDGGTGNDTMMGLAGNDTYWVDSLYDVVVEASRGGTDTVITTVDNYVLAAQVEALQMAAGTDPLGATGNVLDNTMLGNAGNNRLDGGGGTDSMSGGQGDDFYIVNSTGDTVTELVDEGMDTIESSITWTLGLNVENLTLTGQSAINGTGNELNNALIGNSAKNVLNGSAGNDRLDGGVGADAMTGGLGDDVYVVDDALDTTVEAASGGVDTVESSITWTLSAEVEQLLLTGTSATNGTGNALDNRITGNAQANTLTGNAGNDTLDGAGGNDTLVGGGAADTFVFAAGSGTDTISDFSVAEGDRVQIALAVNGSAIVDAATALGAAHASGANVTIDLGGGNSITLIGVTLTELTTAQFVVA